MNDIEVVEADLTRLLGFFPRVDAKAAGLFTVNSAILTLSVMNVQAGDLAKWYIAIPGVSVLLGLVNSYACLYRCNFPDLGGGQGSLIYFAEIAKRTEIKFVSDYDAMTEADYRLDMLGQVWRNATVLCAKYKAVAAAIRLTLATLLPFSIFLIATAIEHSRVPLLKG